MKCMKTIVAICAGAAWLHAAPYIGYVYPAGGQQGTSLQLIVGGNNIVSKYDFGHVSGEGVTVRDIAVVPGFPNPSGVQRKWILDWLAKIDEGKMEKPPLPTKQEHLDEWREHAWWDNLDKLDDLKRNLVLRDLLTRRNSLQSAPSIRQMAIVTVDIAADAPPGQRELRLWNTSSGVSVPRKFYVSKMPHQCEPRYIAQSRPQPPLPMITAVPVAVDGQLMPGEVDVYKFKLEKGKSYRFNAMARSLLPFIGDAVPGNCQLVLRLLDADKKEVAFVDDVYFYPDPVLYFKPTESGEYTLEVRDNLYRGREDFVYEVVLDYGEPAPKEYENPFPGIPTLQMEDLAKKKSLDSAQLHCVMGVLLKKNQTDTLRFTGRKGQPVVIKTVARRNGSPMDGILKLYDPEGVKIAESDDTKETFNVGEYIQPVDPYLSLTLPKEGEYRLVLTDRTQGHGADYRYWLRLGPPVPDFAVYSTASLVNVPYGNAARVKFMINRQDGFTNAVRIVCEDYVLSDNVIGPTNLEHSVTFKAKEARTTKPTPIKVFAESVGEGTSLTRQVIPADQMMQAFAYNHLLPAENFYAMQCRMPVRKTSSAKKAKKK